MPALYVNLLERRGARWLLTLDLALREGGAFVAVGPLTCCARGASCRGSRSPGFTVARVRAP